MNKIITFGFPAVLLLLSCEDEKVFGNYKTEPLPENLKFTIVKDESNEILEKNQLTVELSEKISEGQIASIAKQLYNTKKRQSRFHIFYILPGMKIGSGAWATSHFDPNLKIEIHGATTQQDQAVSKNVLEVDGQLVGKWREEQLTSASYVIYKKDKSIFLKTFFKNGQTMVEEITSKQTGKGLRYDYKEEGTGEFFIVNSAGLLEFYNKQGRLFATGSKLE